VTVLTLAVVLPAHTRELIAGFEVPEPCGTREQFETSIRNRVGDAEAEAILASLSLWIREQPDAFTLTMQIGAETRSLQDRDCKQLFRAAVVVAIALWEAPQRSSTPSSASDLPAPVAPRVQDTPKPEAALALQVPSVRILGPVGLVQIDPKVREPRTRVPLGTEFGVSTGLQPKPGLLLGIRGGLELGSLGFWASLRWYPSRGDRDVNNRGVEVTAFGVRAVGAYRLAESIGVELGVSVHGLRGTGLGSNQTASALVWTVGPVMGLWATPVRWGSAFLAAGAEAHLALLRPRFEITDYRQVFRLGAVGGATFLVAGYRFE